MLMITCHMSRALTSGSYIHLAFIPLELIKYSRTMPIRSELPHFVQ